MKTFIPNGGQLEDHKSVEESRLSRRKLLLGGGGIAGGLMLARRADAAPDPARETINDDSNRRPPRLLVADLRGPQGPDMRRGPGANPAAPQSIVVQPGSGENVATPYPFNGKHLSGFLVSNLYSFDTGTLFSARDISSIILTNLGSQPVFVSADADDDKSPAVASPLKHTVQPLQSAIVRSGVQISTAYASADGLVSLVHVREPKNHTSDVFAEADSWTRYRYPEGFPPLPLWISSQLQLDHLVKIDPWKMAGQSSPPGSEPLGYNVYANLWWLPAGSDAGVHDVHHHNFLEIHTQLVGFGRMQKFRDLKTAQQAVNIEPANVALSDYSFPFDASASFAGLYEEHRLAPGATHAPMPIVTTYNAWGGHSDVARSASAENPCFYYPPHQYYSDTDCIWIAFEFHRAS
ncbi:hypothetical protein V7798_01185 [Rhizobium laguerreae]